MSEHTKNARPSNAEKHQHGKEAKNQQAKTAQMAADKKKDSKSSAYSQKTGGSHSRKG